MGDGWSSVIGQKPHWEFFVLHSLQKERALIGWHSESRQSWSVVLSQSSKQQLSTKVSEE
jgi:hypothetical protein